MQKEHEGLFVAFAGEMLMHQQQISVGIFSKKTNLLLERRFLFAAREPEGSPLPKALAFWLPFLGSRPISVILGASDSHMGAVRGLSPPAALPCSPFYASPEELFDVGVG